MGLGTGARRLWRLKAGIVLSLLAASLAALWSVQKISLFPPGLTPRSLQMATASTHVVVDTPTSALIDLRQDTYSMEGLRNRAVLLGNVIASTAVRSKIAGRLELPTQKLRIQAPLTREQAAPRTDSENARRPSDILKSTDQYRLNIQANPTVPVLDIYAQTPTAESATALVNAAVDELRAYLAKTAAAQATPRRNQITLMQLGRGRGVVLNSGISWEVAALAFFVSFLICAATAVFVDRFRAGWRLAAFSERREMA